MFINILLPVYNEELRIKNGVDKTVAYLKSIDFSDYEITIIDNASTDSTPTLAKELSAKYNSVKYLRLEEKGVGIAIKNGVLNNTCDYVGYMDIDLSTNIKHLKQVISLFKKNPNIDIINGSRLNKKSNMQGRKWYRNLTSHGLTLMLKIFLKLKASDSICGFKFFKKEVIQSLIKETQHNNGWFYVIEILLRAERKPLNIYELPVEWTDDYNTTVHVGKLIKNYTSNILKLRKTFKNENIL